MAYTSHGHQIPGTIAEAVKPRMVARCGGVRMCQTCKAEAERIKLPTTPGQMEESNFVSIDKMAVEHKRIRTPMTLGQVAYEEWRKRSATERAWEHLHPGYKKRWEAVAQAVIEEDARQASEIAHANGTQDCHSCE